jgi:L-rhamnose mutarotase
MTNATEKHIKRVGMVIGLKPEQIEAYKALHAGPGIRALLRRAHIHNFNIFIQQFPDGRWYEFAYYEYHGQDFAADSAWLGAQPENQGWLALTDAMQIPLEGQTGWSQMEQVFLNA